MSRSSVFAVCTLFLTAVLSACTRPDIEFIDAWIPAAPPNVKIFAGYFELRNNTAAPIVLDASSAPDFESVELHRTVNEGGLAKMVQQGSITVPAGASRKFAPGGLHLMLIQPRQPVAEGASIPIELNIADRGVFTIDFVVRRMSYAL